jgi:hypothetical protein
VEVTVNSLILCLALCGQCDGCDACVVGETVVAVEAHPACHRKPVRAVVRYFAVRQPVRRTVAAVVRAKPVRHAMRFVLPPYRRCCQ